MLTVSAVLPAFNEEANVERAVKAVVDSLSSNTDGHEVIVVDDGSRDETATVLERLRAEYPSLRVVTHETNRGYGAAVRTGFSAAVHEWVFLIDCDNQFDPCEIALLTAPSAGADIVTGYRKVRRDPLIRRLNAFAFFTLVTILFGRLARDVNCAFKLIRRELLAELDLRSDGALINTELFVRARSLRARIVEVPVAHFPRTAGRQTGANPRVVLRAFTELFRFRAEMRRR